MFFISQQVFIQFIEICHTDLQIKLAELLSGIPFKSRLQNYIIRVFVYFIYSNYSSSPLQTVVSYLWAYDADNVRELSCKLEITKMGKNSLTKTIKIVNS